ncbi:TIGR04282 family arsenosugar biosynthesis glycosyltransferase [Cyanobium sp. FGCU-52]|nr:TIGR04282 family arsenosugar biosynthesis glycosyltransferase [Cyanobium sp. FGCU52]
MTNGPSGRAQLVVLARGPSPGRCKRRLAGGLGMRAAAAVHDRLCAHTLASVAGAPLPAGAEIVLAVQGLGLRAARRWALARWPQHRPRLRIVAQGAGSLGLLMQRQLMRARREGAARVVLIGSDLPSLESADLVEAFRALERAPLVLGPAADGGYWLIGLAGRWPALFAGIPWGSSQVLGQTLAVAEAAGLPVRLLAERGDLDRPGDLSAWR